MDPISKKLLPIFAFSEISVMGALSGALGYQVGVFRKNVFFFSTYLIGVLKKQKKLKKKQIEKTAILRKRPCPWGGCCRFSVFSNIPKHFPSAVGRMVGFYFGTFCVCVSK